jgi:hypothetical protein
MATLIIVHRGRENDELVLNADLIISAVAAHSETFPSETAVTLVGPETFHIRETIRQLVVLSQH